MKNKINKCAMSRVLRWVICCLCGVSLAKAEAEVVDVFFLSGQSNAAGRVTTGYKADVRDGKVDYYYHTDGPGHKLQTSGSTFKDLSPLSTGFYGAEVSIGRRLVDLGYKPAIIKVCWGGTSLGSRWRSDMPDTATRGDWWRYWENETSKALAAITARGDTVNLCGFFWMQGESDSASVWGDSSHYEPLFTKFTAAIKSTLEDSGYDATRLSFVTALTSNHDFLSDEDTARVEVVRTAQKNVMNDLGRLGAWFDTNDAPTFPAPNLHYDEKGVRLIGVRFAEEYAALATPKSLNLNRAKDGENDRLQCVSCGSRKFMKGRAEVSFVPHDTKFLRFKTKRSNEHAQMCLECGFIGFRKEGSRSSP